MKRKAALIGGICLIAVVVVASAVFYLTNYFQPNVKSPDADSIVWQAPIKYNVCASTKAGDRVFLADTAGYVYCYNASTGEALWKVNVDSPKNYRSLLVFGGEVYTTSGQAVLALNQSTSHIETQYRVSSAANHYKFEKASSFSVED
jgi:outer membrane protein assembly factor BamB